MARVAVAEADVLLSPRELAALIKIPEETLAQWRSRGKGPDYLRMGRHARYRMSDIRAWLDASRVSNGAA